MKKTGKKVGKKTGKREVKRGFWKRNYSDIWQYLKESKNYFILVILFFIAFVLIGALIPVPEEIFNKIIESIRELILLTQGMNTYELIVFIFTNNLGVSFVATFLGVFLGIVPFIILLSNAYIIGFVSSIAVSESGFLSLWKLFPHGVFELPAIILSIVVGIKFGMFVFSKSPLKEFSKRFLLCIKVFLLVVLPLLIIAAIIEGILIFYIG